jgi:hypothetical protein
VGVRGRFAVLEKRPRKQDARRSCSHVPRGPMCSAPVAIAGTARFSQRPRSCENRPLRGGRRRWNWAVRSARETLDEHPILQARGGMFGQRAAQAQQIRVIPGSCWRARVRQRAFGKACGAGRCAKAGSGSSGTELAGRFGSSMSSSSEPSASGSFPIAQPQNPRPTTHRLPIRT